MEGMSLALVRPVSETVLYFPYMMFQTLVIRQCGVQTVLPHAGYTLRRQDEET